MPLPPAVETTVQRALAATRVRISALRHASAGDILATVCLVGVLVFNLWVLRAERLNVATPNDANVHAAMVDWATGQFDSGRVPFDGWFPISSLGASRFHQYQSLPHLAVGFLQSVTGLHGLVSWSLYLLLALWPIAVYSSARLFGIGHRQAAFAAVLSPLLGGLSSRGFQWESYIFTGTGLWTMAWGMWLLPFAWATTWRAVSGRGSVVVGAVVLGITIPTHLLVGYLAVLSVPLWILVAPKEFRQRSIRTLMLGIGALAVAAWFLIPFLSGRAYLPHASIYEGKAQFDSFGIIGLSYLATGLIFDLAGRVPAVTALVGWGLWRAIVRSRLDEGSRAILAVFALSLLLLLGRQVLGPLVDLLPGGEDLFLNRFIIGVHMAGLLLAGIGGETFTRLAARERRSNTPMGLGMLAPITLLLLVGVVLLGTFRDRMTLAEKSASKLLEHVDLLDKEDGALQEMLAEADGPGRVFTGFTSATISAWDRPDDSVAGVAQYAGLNTNYQLARLGRDIVGFPRPAWSLMSVQEGFFDDGDVGNYQLFGVRYALLDDTDEPKVPSRLLSRGSGLSLWEIDGSPSYLRVVQTQGPPIAADRDSISTRGASVLAGSGPRDGVYVPIAYAGREAAAPTGVRADFSGQMSDVTAIPEDGRFAGTVSASGPAVVVLSASYDPRWTATVDGKDTPVQMLAPALPGVAIDAGEHEVSFVYRPIGGYWLRILAGGALLFGVGLGSKRFAVSSMPEIPEPPSRGTPEAEPSSQRPKDDHRRKKRRRR